MNMTIHLDSISSNSNEKTEHYSLMVKIIYYLKLKIVFPKIKNKSSELKFCSCNQNSLIFTLFFTH